MNSIYPISKVFFDYISNYHKDINKSWQQYVEDHREFIIQNSKYITVDPDIINEYLYRPIDFIKEYLKITIDIHWIFMYINNIKTNMDFNTQIDRLYIPDTDIIKELRQRYVVFMTNILKNDKVK